MFGNYLNDQGVTDYKSPKDFTDIKIYIPYKTDEQQVHSYTKSQMVLLTSGRYHISAGSLV